MLQNNEFYLNLIRHGQSEINATPDILGQFPDTSLTEIGKNQSLCLKKRLDKEDIDFVYSSTYKRAYDTAVIATGDKYEIHMDEALREYSAGDWNGQNRHDIYNPEIFAKMFAMNSAFLPPGGESMHMVERRASQWLENNILYNSEIIKLANQRKDNNLRPLNLFAFSHGMTIRMLLHYIMGFDSSFTWKLTLENTSICQLFQSQRMESYYHQ